MKQRRRPTTKARRDGVILAVCLPLVFILSAYLDLNEQWMLWTGDHESWELDEVPFALALAATGFGWYAYRRWREYTYAAARQQRTIARLKRVIADRRQTERALKSAKREAELADRAKSEFLANMSHELRTPLNAVIGFSELIKTEQFGPVGTPQYRDYAQDIHQAGHHLLALINDILDQSKIDSGHADLHEEAIDMAALVGSCIRLMANRAVARNVEIVAEFPGGNDIRLRADPRMIKQIVINLLSNAVKFTPERGRVTVRARPEPGQSYVIEVADTGIGIAPADIPKALSRFGQVQGGLDRAYEGSGLGLPLCISLAELHGGTLGIESEPDVGTTVTLRLPAARLVGPAAGSDTGLKAAG